MNDLPAPVKNTALPELRSPVVDAIEAAYVRDNRSYESGSLPASQLGDECERKLFYGFRWAVPPEAFSGRMLRLFSTGSREEARIVADLRRAGMFVQEIDPDTASQWETRFAGGHAKGKADGTISNVPGAEKTPHVLEIKTHNDKSFKALKKDGVEKSKPAHFAQVQLYMHGLGLTRALYVAVNKNDDELHAERIRYDAAAALRLVAKAERIVAASDAPPKLHDDPESKAAWQCRYCPALGVCHQGEFARRNCRTCLSSSPVDGGGWRCERFGKSLTLDDQRAGCGAHRFLPTLVPGEQVDADIRLTRIVYRMPDGGEWLDDGRAAA